MNVKKDAITSENKENELGNCKVLRGYRFAQEKDEETDMNLRRKYKICSNFLEQGKES